MVIRMTCRAVLAALLLVACRKENVPPKADAAPPSHETADAGPRPCTADKDCGAGESCLYEIAGCSQHGICSPPKPGYGCNVGIPMCSCTRKVTFWGGGGCAGQGVTEPWELYGCPCTTDGDCKNGQTCGAAPYAPRGAPAKVCEDKKKR
jgi:Cys-rich repeat protein